MPWFEPKAETSETNLYSLTVGFAKKGVLFTNFQLDADL